MGTAFRRPVPANLEAHKLASVQARKLQGWGWARKLTSMRQYVALDIMINPIYSYTRAARELVSIRSGISHAKRASREKRAAAPNKRRKQWQNLSLSLIMKHLKSKILSTNTASHLPGWKKLTITLTYLKELGLVQEMAAQRIPGSGTAVTSSINTKARASRANQPPTLMQAHKLASVQAFKRPSKQARIADQSSSAQAFERASEIPDSVTAELS